MFDPDSRYAALPTATFTDADGHEVVYVTRRILPRARDLTRLGQLTVQDGDRLDLVAARALGDPLAWYRVADSNEAMHPDDLTAEPGRRLLIAIEGR